MSQPQQMTRKTKKDYLDLPEGVHGIVPDEDSVSGITERATSKIGLEIARWIDQEIQNALPGWERALLRVLPLPIIGRMMGVEVRYFNDIGTYFNKYQVVKNGKVVAEAVFDFSKLVKE